METFTKGDIVICPFPFTDLSSNKLRPALVLSNEFGEDILLCQITSQTIPKDKYTVSLNINDTTDGNLKINSFIRTNMLFTMDTKLIKKKISKIKPNIYVEVIKKIISLISLP